MKKETLEYINGLRNAVKDEFIIGREMAGNSEFVIVSLPDREKPLYALWNSKKAANRYKKVEYCDTDEIIFEKVEPKGTGGEESYVMLMVYAINELNKKDISINAAGAIFKLVDNIEWNTGRICRLRDGKPMNRKMLMDELGVCENKLKCIIKELKNLGVVHYDKSKKAYYFNRKYIRKGAAVNED